jgi:mannitol-1-phosphate/altronate dehydrogenase
MDIRNLLNYLEEQVIVYTPNVDDIIEDQLQERSGLQVEVNNDEADDSQELLVVSVVEAYKMVEMLERFWMQQDDSGIPFVATS